MSIIDAIKNSVLEGFDTNVTSMDILLGLGASLFAGLFILLIYKNVQKDTGCNRGYCLTLLLVTSISAMIVLTITSNLALSLGMVGALSIVRFRTAIKDTSDTAFLFWGVAAGITAGARFYVVTLIGCLFIGAVCMVSATVLDKYAKTFLLVVRAESADAANSVEGILNKCKMQYQFSALTQTDAYTEVIYELAFSEKHKSAMQDLQNIPGIKSVSLVDCRKN